MPLIKPPPYDAEGNVVPHDHPEIKEDWEIIRRISDNQIIDKSGRRVISTIAYKSSSKNDGVSMDIKPLIEADGLDPKEWVTTPRWIGSVLFRVHMFRSLDLMVGHDPITEPEENPYHGQIWGKFPRSTIKKLRSLAEWYVEIENVELE